MQYGNGNGDAVYCRSLVYAVVLCGNSNKLWIWGVLDWFFPPSLSSRIVFFSGNMFILFFLFFVWWTFRKTISIRFFLIILGLSSNKVWSYGAIELWCWNLGHILLNFPDMYLIVFNSREKENLFSVCMSMVHSRLHSFWITNKIIAQSADWEWKIMFDATPTMKKKKKPFKKMLTFKYIQWSVPSAQCTQEKRIVLKWRRRSVNFEYFHIFFN